MEQDRELKAAKERMLRPAVWNGEDTIQVKPEDAEAFRRSAQHRGELLESRGAYFVTHLNDPTISGGVESLERMGFPARMVMRAIALHDLRQLDEKKGRMSCEQHGFDLVQREIAAGVRDFDGELLEKYRAVAPVKQREGGAA